MVGAEVDLVLGEDHPLRHLPAKLAPLEREPVRERCAGERHGDARAGAEVPRAADDLRDLSAADVDGRELQPVGVRVLVGREHTADLEERRVGRPSPVDPVDLGRDDREQVGDLLRRRLHAHVLAQPAHRDAHQNCLRKRRSFSQKVRMLEMP